MGPAGGGSRRPSVAHDAYVQAALDDSTTGPAYIHWLYAQQIGYQGFRVGLGPGLGRGGDGPHDAKPLLGLDGRGLLGDLELLLLDLHLHAGVVHREVAIRPQEAVGRLVEEVLPEAVVVAAEEEVVAEEDKFRFGIQDLSSIENSQPLSS